ncbi:hypothetical protein BELL_0704g00030 [Botrytis elliptica]|uniref:O-methyltransferase C-terminal domain-containing protein n=1 Tax=Botrytis elliptica TaxID=278938 RepID=A0A4Z1JNU3_9HELO|nr:hypothetical protein EAE99_002434 [Botrytis elliptica]TGO70567.1 hypothetical protein BELL_0704g00030 [Botrytis elliptica]
MTEKSLESLASSIKLLASEVQNAREKGSEDIEAFEKLIDALDDMRADLVGPMRWPGTLFAPPDFAALQTALLHDVFQHVPTNGKDTASASIHVKDLSKSVKIPADTLLRIMRLLAANKIFLEIDEKVFCHTPLSAGMVDEMVSARLGSFFNGVFKASSSLSDAIDAGKRSAWEVRFGMPMYEYFEKIPKSDRERMAKSMAISSIEEIEDLSVIFPWEKFNKIVDIGGSAGHLVVHLAKKFMHLQCVSQDLLEVTADQIRRIASLSPTEKSLYDRVEFESHDYYTPQTRIDADAFILRRCLHNNPDDDCIKMIKAVIPGLEHNPKARLLINEKLMPVWNSSDTRYKTKMLRREDIAMMISVGGKERTLEEFAGLIRGADKKLEISEVYYGKNYFSVISVRLAR